MIKRRRQNRMAIIALAGLVLSVAVALTMFALNDQIVFFKSPSDIARDGLQPGVTVRVGGMVKVGSCDHKGKTVTFVVTDFESDLPVVHTGLRPDLFREGQGVVMDGSLNGDNIFEAKQILAKHDENYVPAEVAAAMKGRTDILQPSPDAKGDCA